MTFSSGHIKGAVKNLRSSRSRSFFTMFGIIIGVASVIVIVGIDSGVVKTVTGQINSYSKNVITISSNIGSSSLFGNVTAPEVASTLTTNDVRSLEKIKSIADVVPLGVVPGSITGASTYNKALVLSTTPNFLNVVNQSLSYGNFFNNIYINQNTAVLGASVADKIFNNQAALGNTFTFRGRQFVVAGILNSFNQSPFSNVSVYNNAVFIPTDIANQITGTNNSNIFEILVKAQPHQNLNTVSNLINSTLTNNHGGQTDFNVLLPSQLIHSKTSILTLLTDLTIGTAIIALFVSGVGIMNVMLVSVTERMHEIGIRKAIGATNQQIMNQFLVESLTVSVVGGIFGILLGMLIIFIINVSTTLSAIVDWQIILIAFVSSLVIGIVFGSIPALKASFMQPIDALRSE